MTSIRGRPPTDGEIEDWLSYVNKEKAPSSPGGRSPTRSERELWERYSTGGQMPPPEKKPAPQKKIDSPQMRASPRAAAPVKLDALEIGSKAPTRAGVQLPDEKSVIQLPGYQLDGKIRRRLTSGKIEPEGKLDLHGMNRKEAEKAVASFVLSSFRSGRRLILIVTGKGREKNDTGPIPQRTGILRRSLQTWLDAPPLAEIVQFVSFAHDAHGGSGAFYVYLRRKKANSMN